LSVSHEVVEITRAQVDEFCGNVLEVRGTGGRRVLAMSSRAFAAFTDAQLTVHEPRPRRAALRWLLLTALQCYVDGRVDRCCADTRTSWCTPPFRPLKPWAVAECAA
jgi:hypothetical protein